MSKIRPLEKNDQNRVHELFLFLNTREPVLFDVDEFINDPNCHCIVVEEDGIIAGFGALIIRSTPSKGRVAHIEDVVIDKGFQGRGLGKMLTLELIEIAKKENIHEINLTSKKIRTTAHKFYESLGFVKRESDIFRLNI